MLRFVMAVALLSSGLLQAEMTEPKVTKILKVKSSPYGGSRVKLRVSGEIPLKYWVNCNYYGPDGEIHDSTSHVLLERVPVWSVDMEAEDIKFAICFVPG